MEECAAYLSRLMTIRIVEMVLFFVIGSVIWIISKKIEAPKWILILLPIVMVLYFFAQGKELVDISLDIKNQSYVTYIGTVEYISTDTLLLHDEKETRLYHARFPYIEESEEVIVIYSERSEFTLEYKKLE